jgi:hypothetical protein
MLYCGLDVSLKQTALCVVDGEGRVVREARLATDPEVISRFLQENELGCERIGLESGGTSSWLCLELRRLGHPRSAWDQLPELRVRRGSGAKGAGSGSGIGTTCRQKVWARIFDRQAVHAGLWQAVMELPDIS